MFTHEPHARLHHSIFTVMYKYTYIINEHIYIVHAKGTIVIYCTYKIIHL